MCQLSFKEHEGALDHTQRDGRQKNHQRDAHAHSRVGVVPAIVFGLPDDQRGCHDTEIVGCIAQNVDEDTHHSQVSMVMPTVPVLMAMTVTVIVAMVVTLCRDGIMRFLVTHMLVIMMLNFISTLTMKLIEEHLPWQWNPRRH